MAEDKFVLLEIRDFIAKLSINRPKALNALNGEVNEQLDACLDELARRQSVFGIPDYAKAGEFTDSCNCSNGRVCSGRRPGTGSCL